MYVLCVSILYNCIQTTLLKIMQQSQTVQSVNKKVCRTSIIISFWQQNYVIPYKSANNHLFFCDFKQSKRVYTIIFMQILSKALTLLLSHMLLFKYEENDENMAKMSKISRKLLTLQFVLYVAR